jgi:hypothetical protein
MKLFLRVKQPSNNILVQLLMLLVFTTSIPSLVFAEANEQIIPKNSHTKTYGNGWECNLGFQTVGNICVAIKTPKNAYLTNSSFGNGWKCNWGHRKNDDTCTIIMIPANAYLDSYSYEWQCDRSFKKNNNSCVAIKIPENGYFVSSSYGKGWDCERGYLEKKILVLS